MGAIMRLAERTTVHIPEDDNASGIDLPRGRELWGAVKQAMSECLCRIVFLMHFDRHS